MHNEKSPLDGGPGEHTTRGYHIRDQRASSKSLDYRIRCALDWVHDHKDNGPTRQAALIALGQTLIDYLANVEGI